MTLPGLKRNSSAVHCFPSSLPCSLLHTRPCQPPCWDKHCWAKELLGEIHSLPSTQPLQTLIHARPSAKPRTLTLSSILQLSLYRSHTHPSCTPSDTLQRHFSELVQRAWSSSSGLATVGIATPPEFASTAEACPTPVIRRKSPYPETRYLSRQEACQRTRMFRRASASGFLCSV